MQGCGRSCGVQLVVWAVASAGFFIYARSVGRAGAELWAVSIGVGLVTTMALLIAHSAAGAEKKRRILLRAGTGTPGDGQWTAVSGEIRSSAPLRAPLSGEPVVMYEYSLGRDQRVGKSMSFITWFDGKALTASTIATSAGAIRLLAVPRLEVEAALVEPARAVSNARDYIRRATFALRDTSRQRTSALEREWADDDGVFRIDKKYSSEDVDLLDGLRFEERHIRQGETVCAFGVYSPERRALVPDTRWGRPARIMRGSGNEAARALRGRVIRYVVGAIILAAIAAGGAIAYL